MAIEDPYKCAVGNMAKGHTPSTRVIRSQDDEPPSADISLSAGGQDIGELHPAMWILEKQVVRYGCIIPHYFKQGTTLKRPSTLEQHCQHHTPAHLLLRKGP